MKQGDVILTPVPQADGNLKNRPAIFLRENAALSRSACVWCQYTITSWGKGIWRTNSIDWLGF